MSPRTFEQEIYDELRALAAHRMRGQNPGHTLQATALVHEVFEKMARGNPTLIRDRNHFFALASLAMHQVLVQHARQRAAQKRGGGWHRVTLNEGLVPGRTQEFDLYTLHELLEELDELDTRQAQIVKMRYFSGMSHEEVASYLRVSASTVKREWRMARAWLAAGFARGERD
ncbi:MAG: RNA polymerase subunit sigma-24 [Planctomycetes bacterium]|nr:RNA polymerase subunit sigma-24 [Planctomycetota bacterium]